MSRLNGIGIACLILAGAVAATRGEQSEALEGQAFDLPGIKVVKEQTLRRKIDGKYVELRKVVFYEHESMASWGYEKPQKDFFILVNPKKSVKAAPLCVVLHSAGGSAKRPMGGAFGYREPKGYYRVLAGLDETFYLLCLDCSRLGFNKAKDGVPWHDYWWGDKFLRRNKDAYRDKLCPTEKRVLSTVEWVTRSFGVDRNRVYLAGLSMGGSGALGIGFSQGDVFAAVFVAVPAGARHFEYRTAGCKFPDPPPLVNVSSHMDKHSKGQERVIGLCRDNRYSLAFTWGPFGHGDSVKTDPGNPAVLDFPWFVIRKDQAYPVFTNATTDRKYPGHNNDKDPDQEGQINGYFRWRNIEDTVETFIMELRLVTKKELKRPVQIPPASVADVTLRRLQKFRPNKGKSYEWSVKNGDISLQSGTVHPDADGLLTIPKVKITEKPARLVVKGGELKR